MSPPEALRSSMVQAQADEALPSGLARDAARLRMAGLALGAATVAGVAGWAVLRGTGELPALAGATGAVFLSKLAIFGGLFGGHPFDPWSLALLAWVVDLWVALAIVVGLGRIERLPLVGPGLVRARRRAHATVEGYPGLFRTAVAGVVLLVFLPLPGSGAVSGSLVGRLVGLARFTTFGAVTCGSLLAVTSYAAAAHFLGGSWESIVTSPEIATASVFGLAVFAWIAWRRVRAALRAGPRQSAGSIDSVSGKP